MRVAAKSVLQQIGGRTPALAVLTAVACVVLFGAGRAAAFDEYKFVGSIADGLLAHPTKLAVDDATGNVLVVDSGHSKVQVWGAGGLSSSHLLDFGVGPLSRPYGIAIDQDSGDVYASNAAANEQQRIFIEGAESGTYTLTFEGQTTAPIAFDAGAATIQAALAALSTVGTGNVQVEDGGFVTFGGALAETNLGAISGDAGGLTSSPDATAAVTVQPIQEGGKDKLLRFQPDDRQSPTAYAVDPSFPSPPQGSDATTGEIGSFASPLAVDPVSGDLLVADTGNNFVERFDSSGVFVSSFDGSATEGGAFQNLFDLVVGDDGTTYVLDATGPFNPVGPEMTGTSRVELLDSSGDSLGAVPNVEGRLTKARSLGFGVASGSLIALEQKPYAPPASAHVYRDQAPYQDLAYQENGGFPFSFQSGGVGVAIDDSSAASSGRIYGLRDEGRFNLVATPGIEVFDRLKLPDLTIGSVTDVGGTTAHLAGAVDPIRGSSWSVHFEYRKVGDGGEWTSTSTEERSEAISEGEPPRAVEAELSGLVPNVAYEAKVVASNEEGSHESATTTFSTSAIAPGAVTGGATDRTASGATLRGSVTPFGASTHYHFEYGTTTAYGFQAPAGHEAVAGKGQAPLLVAQNVTGLQPETTYHYRLVAENEAGQTPGDDRTFATTAGAGGALDRAYELVSPVAKNGSNVKPQLGMQGSLDGNVLTYLTTTEIGLSETATFLPRYVAHRTADGWINHAPDPPQAATVGSLSLTPIKVTVGVSEDGTKAVVLSSRALAPGSVEGDGNIYLRDVASGAYTTIATTENHGWFRDEVYLNESLFAGGTPSFDHVLLLGAGVSLIPGAPNRALYDFSGGQLNVVSRDEDGQPVAGSGVGTADHDKFVISPDGSRILFSSPEGVYLRSEGTSLPLSRSRSSAEPGVVRTGVVAGSDRKLEKIYFASHDLTDDSISGELSLYSYDVSTDALSLLTPLGNELYVAYLQVSERGESVFFITQASLTPDAGPEDFHPNIYVWRAGKVMLIAKLNTEYDSFGVGATRGWWASPNGRYFTFLSASTITDYNPISSACQDFSLSENGSCLELYRYDTVEEDLLCVSCRPDGQLPTSSASIGFSFAEVGSKAFSRAVTDEGRVFFSSQEQLVDGDSNGTWDVYEFDGEQNRLISTGQGTGSIIGEVSKDGRDVFFTTQDRLVAVDTDDSVDVYDARVGGGIASQSKGPPAPICSHEDCHLAPLAPMGPPSGSESAEGRGNVRSRPRHRCRKGHKAQKVHGKRRCVRRHGNHNNRRQGR